MDYTNLGRTGLVISRVVVGAATFGETADQDAATAIVDRSLDLGITTFDTADAYTKSQSETLLGHALRGRRERVVICSKVGLPVAGDESDHAVAVGRQSVDFDDRWARGMAPTDSGLSRRHIVRAVEDSLRRLQTDYIDLYQVHLWDASTPIEETLAALDHLVNSGKVLYVGASAFTPWELYKALWTSDVRGWCRLESMQVGFSLLQREPTRDMLPACAAEQVAVLAFRPLAGGMLSGRFVGQEQPDDDSRFALRSSYRDRFWNDPTRAAVERYCDAANSLGHAPDELALAWALHQRGVTAVVCGASKPSRLDGFARATQLRLSTDDLRRVEAAVHGEVV